jgi:hypothetical protein
MLELLTRKLDSLSAAPSPTLSSSPPPSSTPSINPSQTNIWNQPIPTSVITPSPSSAAQKTKPVFAGQRAPSPPSATIVVRNLFSLISPEAEQIIATKLRIPSANPSLQTHQIAAAKQILATVIFPEGDDTPAHILHIFTNSNISQVHLGKDFKDKNGKTRPQSGDVYITCTSSSDASELVQWYNKDKYVRGREGKSISISFSALKSYPDISPTSSVLAKPRVTLLDRSSTARTRAASLITPYLKLVLSSASPIFYVHSLPPLLPPPGPLFPQI